MGFWLRVQAKLHFLPKLESSLYQWTVTIEEQDGSVSANLSSKIKQQEELMNGLYQKQQKLKVICPSLQSQLTWGYLIDNGAPRFVSQLFYVACDQKTCSTLMFHNYIDLLLFSNFCTCVLSSRLSSRLHSCRRWSTPIHYKWP